MNNNIELLKCKVALFKMLDRFSWQTEYKGEYCLSTLCESAGEWAFNALGLEDDPITMEKFYTEYDKIWTEWCHANGTEPGFSYLEFHKRNAQDIKPWKLIDDELDELAEEDIMAEIIGKYIVYTADDEMPDCLSCDHCDGDCDCSKFCGPEYGWAGYKRTEEVARNE